MLYVKPALREKLSQGYGNQSHNEQPIPGNSWVLSHFSSVRLGVIPWAAARQTPLSRGFSRKEHWSGLPLPPPGDRPDPGTEPMSLFSPALAGGFFTTSTTWEAPEDTDHSYYTGKAAAALPRSLLIPWISSELLCLLTFLYPPPSFCLLYS